MNITYKSQKLDQSIRATAIPLKIIRKVDILIDGENRIYDENILFKKTIFDIEELNILNSKNISFQDCIFTGSLRVSNKALNIPAKIFIDNVIIKKELFVSGAFNISDCVISDINCTGLNILNNEGISNLSVTNSNIGTMIISNTEIDTFRA